MNDYLNMNRIAIGIAIGFICGALLSVGSKCNEINRTLMRIEQNQLTPK